MADNGQVEQDCRCTGQDDLGPLAPQEKDDLSRLEQFKTMSGEEQISFLTRKVWEFMSPLNIGKTWKKRLELWTKEFALCNCERGRWAKRLRGVVKDMKLDVLFSHRYKRFMNEGLREFLNLNEKGTMVYKWGEVYKQEGWSETISLEAAHHQYEVPIKDGFHNNAKFLHEDGREVIFNYNKERVDTHIDRGTFNYVPVEKPSAKQLATVAMLPVVAVPMTSAVAAVSGAKLVDTFSRHDMYDVKPWKALMLEECSEELPKIFTNDVHKFRDYRCLFKYVLKENSEIWRIN